MMRALVLLLMCACGGPKDEVAEQQAAPAPMKAVPLAGGDTFDQTPSCLVGTLAELKKHPHWMVRIDEYTSYFPNLDAPPRLESQIERDATGAIWHDGWDELSKRTTALPADAIAALDAALAASCTDPDAGAAYREGDVRWFEIGYGPGTTSAMKLPVRSAVTAALTPLFSAARARHIADRLPHARTTVIALKGKQWKKGKWRPWSAKIDLSSGFTDADVVELADWAASQPESLPRAADDEFIVTGTLTADGASRPIAITLWTSGDRAAVEWGRPPFKPLLELYAANRFQ